MNEDHLDPNELQSCGLCGERRHCPGVDKDLNMMLCAECFPHVVNANFVMKRDLESAGIKTD